MMNPRKIKQRKRVFFGCEGKSEFGYAARLRQLINDTHHNLHINVELLRPGGGDPLTLIERAKEMIAQEKRRAGYVPYKLIAILLDTDLLGQKHKDRRAIELAKELNATLIWQNPCHEAFLLRHIEGCSDLRPSSKSDASNLLIRQVPAYAKGLSAAALSKFISHSEIVRAAKVEKELELFLKSVQYL
jgi:hypothetical protein